MRISTRARAGDARMTIEHSSDGHTARLPTGLLPLAIAIMVLVAVPLARADGDSPTSGGATPIAGEAAMHPQINGRLVRSRSISGSAIAVRARVRGAGRRVVHVRMAVRSSGARRWHTVRRVKVRGGKAFTLRWRDGRPGRYMTRVSVRKYGRSDADRTGRAYVFRRSYASYYGPGLYGGGLACGGRLTPRTVGVAHKTLPCGTRVTFKVGRRVVTARVIDRGPYIAGRDWDLTAALKRKLGFGSTGPVYATR